MGDRPGHPFRGNQWGDKGVSVSRGDYRVREEDPPYKKPTKYDTEMPSGHRIALYRTNPRSGNTSNWYRIKDRSGKVLMQGFDSFESAKGYLERRILKRS